MRIVLARHGKPSWDFRTPIPGHGFCAWRRGEDAASLDPSLPPPAALQQLTRTAPCLVASSLRRSWESAQLLAPVLELIDAQFREAELPCAFRSGLRFPPQVWGGVARTAWFCGWSAGAESFRVARERAARAARMLEGYAESHGSVVLVGHGLMNKLIAAALRKTGWRGPRFPSFPHWGFGVYEPR